MKKMQQNDLAKAIEKMSIGGRNQFADCFGNFLDLALSYFCNNMDERQMRLRKHLENDDAFRQAYTDALNAYGDLAEDYHDPLGDLFMERISHGQLGQFFTPESLSLLMSEIVGIGDGETLNDPTCGSGRMLLMALKTARNEGKEPIIYANDISMACAKMTLLNFCVNSVDGEVTCGDSLKLDYENFTFFKLDKVRNLVTGAVLTTYWQYNTDNLDEVNDKRAKWMEWIAKHGWVKYRHNPDRGIVGEIMDEPLDAEVKIEANGQTALF